MKDENILISACLLGMNIRYDGKGEYIGEIEKLKERYHLVPVCPEIYGGLETPREPAERLNGRVVTRTGADVTGAFLKGAREALKLAVLFQCKYAVLKELSPSCGSGMIYDGSFSGALTAGYGVTAEMLRENGVTVLGESRIGELLK